MPNEQATITLCVRSVWDLYFQARKFPPGSEVLMTAINIQDMIKITEEHGLVPVPVDIDPYTLMPSLDAIKAATTEKSVACLFGFIWGVTYDVAPFATYLHSQNIDIIEDTAQSWRGLETFRGSPHAVMTMFSFGTIKLQSAFYGAVSIVRDRVLFD